MFNHIDIVKMINQAARNTFISMKPVEISYGTVTSISPLYIAVDQKSTLTEEQLVLTRNVSNYAIELTEESIGTKTYQVNNALKEGEKVVLLRVQGGQDYLVYDRVV